MQRGNQFTPRGTGSNNLAVIGMVDDGCVSIDATGLNMIDRAA